MRQAKLAQAGENGAGQKRIGAGHHPVVIHEFGRVDAGLLGQTVAAPDHQRHGFAVDGGRKRKLAVHPERHAPYGKVEPSGQELLAEEVGGGDDGFDGHPRQGEAGGAQRGQKPVECGAGDRADADMAGPAGGDFRDLAFGIAQFGHHAGGAAGKGFAHGRQGDAAPRADVDGLAGNPLNLGQQARGGGLGDGEAVGGGADLAGFGQGVQKAEVAEFQPLSQQAIGVIHIKFAINASPTIH